MRQRRRLLVTLFAALAATACTTNPVTGRRELLLMSTQEEARAGAQAAAQVKQEMGLVPLPALTAYVRAIGERLARHSPRQDVTYRFAVADAPEPNAFALPGGYIYVTRGLLELTNSEAELANVIGHEIGHVAARHAAQRQTQALGANVLSALGTILAGAAGGAQAAQVVGSLGQVAAAGYVASYSRDQERQADAIGQDLAAKAGWDPAAMASFLHTLERYSALQGQRSGGIPTFLQSHPLTSERVRAATLRAAKLDREPAPPIAGSRGAFLKRIDGVVVGPDPRDGVFQGSHFVQPVLGFALDFPAGWATQNGRQAVGAVSPARDAQVLLETQGRGDDPARAAALFADHAGIALQQGTALRIGGLPAYHAAAVVKTGSGSVGADLTWIALGETLYRITGAASLSRFSAYTSTFRRVAASFRSVGGAEVEGIRTLRLRAVQVRRGETLASFDRRTGNAWSPAMTAVANGLGEPARLSAGEWLKIARPGPLQLP